jgi:hypothetical protein
LVFARDGSFRIEDVLPGTYILHIQTPELMTVAREVVVPDIPGGRTDVPLNIGVLTIR